MGIEDRDYYRKAVKEQEQSPILDSMLESQPQEEPLVFPGERFVKRLMSRLGLTSSMMLAAFATVAIALLVFYHHRTPTVVPAAAPAVSLVAPVTPAALPAPSVAAPVAPVPTPMPLYGIGAILGWLGIFVVIAIPIGIVVKNGSVACVLTFLLLAIVMPLLCWKFDCFFILGNLTRWMNGVYS